MSAIVQSTFRTGRKSGINGTAARLTASALTSGFLKRGVTIKAASGNTNKVYVGNSDVTTDSADGTDGFPLSANDTVTVETDDPFKVFVVGDVAGPQKVFWVGD